MTPLAETDKLFFERADATLDRAAAEHVLGEALAASDDGELYLEYRESESISLDDGRIRSAGFDTSLGFGLRAVAGEATGYAHAGELSEPALRRAAASVAAVASGHSGPAAEPPRATNSRLYSDANPLGAAEFPARTALLSEIDVYARGKDPRVKQVMASIMGEWQAVQIMRPDGTRVADLRPLVRLNVAVVVEKDGRRETGSYGTGGRFSYDKVTDAAVWRASVDEALRQALVNLDSVPAPAGEMEVVLGSGWPGILLHEAIGHGLEGDFNRKKTSAFSGLLGQRIAAKSLYRTALGELHNPQQISFQVRPAELRWAGVILQVRAETVAAQHALEDGSQQTDQHCAAAGGCHRVDHVPCRHESPQEAFSPIGPPARLIHVQYRFML